MRLRVQGAGITVQRRGLMGHPLPSTPGLSGLTSAGWVFVCERDEREREREREKESERKREKERERERACMPPMTGPLRV